MDTQMIKMEKKWKSRNIWRSNKARNKQIKITNGNRQEIKKLKIIHWNGGGCRWENKTIEIESLVLEYKPDICYISEANLWNEVEELDRRIPGYTLYYPNTMTSLGHARLILLAREGLKLQLVSTQNDKELAMVWIKVGTGKNNSVLIGGLYRQHQLLGQADKNFTNAEIIRQQELRWEKVVQTWINLSNDKNCIVVGDINLDQNKWNNPVSTQEHMVDLMKDNIETKGFQQLVTGVTRTMRNSEDSLIDHVWSNCLEKTIKIINKSRGSSDHNIVGIEVKLKGHMSGGSNVLKRCWKNFDEKECINAFKRENWTDILNIWNLDVAVWTLEDRIMRIMDVHAPFKVVQQRSNYKNWIGVETKSEMKLRDDARKKAKQSDLEIDWLEFRNRRNKCTSMQRQDKKQYLDKIYKDIEEDKNTRELFSVTRKLLGWSQAGPPNSLKIDGNILLKQKLIADAQMNYYTAKIEKVKKLLPQVNTDPLVILKRIFQRWKPTGMKPKFELKCVTEKEIGIMIQNLKNGHSFGTDKIDAYTIKMAAAQIIPSITHVINLSLSLGKFPARWKISRILPLLKGKGLDALNPASYRPVSQLPVIAKLTERSVQRQLLMYLEQSNQLSPNQHAYRENHNTATALLQLMDAISVETDNNKITATMNMDLTAAFDCVPHRLLIEKLDYYGIDDITKSWISSYLMDRSAFVAIGSEKSIIKPTPQGVPQGSVIGPLLYLIHINEMTNIVENTDCKNEVHLKTENLFNGDCKDCGAFIMYADDGQFQFASNSRGQNQDKIDNIFWNIRDYLNANGLLMNESKTMLTEFMSYQKRTKISGIPPDITVRELTIDKNGKSKLQDELITDTGGCRLLGVNLTNNQTWDGHLLTGQKSLLPNIRKHIGLISRIGTNMSRTARLKLANAHVTSRLSYMICLWGNTNDSLIKKIQVVQNLAARMITGDPRTTRQKELLEKVNWMNVKNLTEYHSLCQIWKLKKFEKPLNLWNKIELLDDNKLSTKKPRLQLTSQTFRCKSIIQWNKLPDNLRSEITIKRFKINLKKWLKERTLNPETNEEDQLVPHGSQSDNSQGPHGSQSDNTQVLHGSQSDNMQVPSDNSQVPHGSLSENSQVPHGSQSDNSQVPQGSLIDNAPVPDGYHSDNTQELHGSLSDNLQVPHGSLSENSQNNTQVPHGSPLDNLQVLHGSKSNNVQVPHGSQPDNTQAPYGSQSDNTQVPHGSLSDNSQVPNGSLSDNSQVLHGSLSENSQLPHGSLLDNSQGPHGSLSDNSQVLHGSLSENSQVPHGSQSDNTQVPHGTPSDNSPVPHGSQGHQENQGAHGPLLTPGLYSGLPPG